MTKKNIDTVVERSRPGSLGKLYDVLDDAFPVHRTRLGFLNVREVADDLKVSSQYMYKLFSTERLPVSLVKPLIKLSRGKLTLDKLSSFIFT